MGLFGIFKSVFGGESETVSSNPGVTQKNLATSLGFETPDERIVVMAIVKNGRTAYYNRYSPDVFTRDDDALEFRGPIYKIVSRTTIIFYGLVTDDRRGMVMSMTPLAFDTIRDMLARQLGKQIPDIVRTQEILAARTWQTYYLSEVKNGFYVTNNSGSDSFLIPSGGSLISGNRSTVLASVRWLNS
jgi:hypothetical protein